MGGGHANHSVKPQHHGVQRNKFHTFSINVWSRGSVTKGDKTPELENYNRDTPMPK
jgi:hypothetical protein